MGIIDQLDLAAWQHELRAPDGRWVKGAGIAAQLSRPRPKQWEFIGPHGSGAGAAFLPGNHEPEVGDMARDGHGGVGRVISKGGGHVVLDADDGNRYLVDWRNGGNVVREVPLGDAPWHNPHEALKGVQSPTPADTTVDAFWRNNGWPDWRPASVIKDPHPPNPKAPWVIRGEGGEEIHVSDKNAQDVRKLLAEAHRLAGDGHSFRSQIPVMPPTPPGTYMPGGKQLILEGLPEEDTGPGPGSPEVQRLKKLMPQVNQALADYRDEITHGGAWRKKEGKTSVETPNQGAQGQTSIVTLPDGTRVISKIQSSTFNDAEELADYVSQVIGAQAPAVARDPDDPEHIIEDMVPGTVAYRYAAEQAEEGGDWSGYDSSGILDELTSGASNAENIGLLDYLTGQIDRHDGNYIVTDDGDVRPIDQGLSFQGWNETDSPFWHADPEAYDPEYLAEVRKGLEKLRSQFIRVGENGWYDGMMRRLEALESDAAAYRDSDLSLTEQAGLVELSWKDAWLHEARDSHGRWTKGLGSTAKTYKLPDPARLHNDRSEFKSPGDHPFFKAHPVSAANVVRRFDEASDSERAQGMNWYADAHELAKAMDPDITRAAGVIAAYSPQTAWYNNMLNAAKALRQNRALGKEDGMITASMQANAQKALDGKPLDEVLKSPKTNDFGHLIAHGGDAADDPYGKVVIDRHAMSVAMGGAIPKKIADTAPIDTRRYYEHVADVYRQAALEISKREGMTVSPHQLQAITWLRQQDINESADQAAGASGDRVATRLQRGRETARRNGWKRWTEYDWETGLPTEIGTTALPGNAVAPRIESSPDGFSISMGSGGTPKAGFMVAHTDSTHTFPDSVMKDERALADAIDQMLLAEHDVFSQPNVYLGGWVHDGKLWLEPSENVVSRAEAERLAKERNQIAIWDVSAGEEIQTGGTGGGAIYNHDAPAAHGQAGAGGAGGLRAPPGGGKAGYGIAASSPAQGGIAGQFFELSWKDAWKTELRAPDGRWVRGAGLAEQASSIAREPSPGRFSAEDYRNEISALLKDQRRKGPGPGDVVIGHLKMANAKLYYGDTSAAIAELRNAWLAAFESGDKSAEHDIKELAQRIEADQGWKADMEKAATAYTAKGAAVVPDILGGGRESWTGKIDVFPDDKNRGIAGEMTWAGDMLLAASVASKIKTDQDMHNEPVVDPQVYSVVMHELVHGLIDPGPSDESIRAKRAAYGIKATMPIRHPEYRDNQKAYQDETQAAIEEGFTELATVHHAAEFFRRTGIGDRELSVLRFGPADGGYGKPLTLAEHAEKLDDPAEVGNWKAWGHYGWQTAAAQAWCQEIAKSEGLSDLSKGTPGYERMKELSDEVNRVGTSDKAEIMARQVIRSQSGGAGELPPVDLNGSAYKELVQEIIDGWPDEPSGTQTGRTAAHRALKAAKARAARLEQERVAMERA